MTDLSAFDRRLSDALERYAAEVDVTVDAARVAAGAAAAGHGSAGGLLGGGALAPLATRRLPWLVLAPLFAALALGLALVGAWLFQQLRPLPVVNPSIVEVVTDGRDVDLVAGADGKVWLVGVSRLVSIDPATLALRRWDVADNPGFVAWAAAPAGDGGLWVSQVDGVARFDGTRLGARIAAPSGAILPLVAEGPDGTLWAAGGNALFRRVGDAWQRIDLPRADADALDLAIDTRGSAWVVSAVYGDETVDYQLARWDGSAWRDVRDTDVRGVDSNISSIVALPDGGIAVAWDARIERFDGSVWTDLEAPPLYGAADGWLLAVDADGTMWAGFDGSAPSTVGRLDPGGWRLYGTADGLPAAIDDWSTTRIATSGGSTFVLASDGVYRLVDDSWVLVAGTERQPVLRDARVAAVSAHEAWALDVGGYRFNATYLWHFVDGTAQPVLESERPGIILTDIAVLRDGTPVVASTEDVAAWTGSGWLELDQKPALAIAVGPDGRVWAVGAAGTSSRVLARSGEGWLRMDLPRPPTSGRIIVDGRGEPWIAASLYGPGLVRLRDGEWQPMTPAEVSCPPSAGCGRNPQFRHSNLAVAPNGDVWVTIDAIGAANQCCTPADPAMQVARFDGTTWTVYGTADGLPADNASFGLAITPEGTVWLGGSNLSTFDGRRWTEQLAMSGLGTLSASPDGALWASGSLGTLRISTDGPQQ
ncbi:MAG: hypothetical protein FIA92_04045 [Chloroflexi bacterium]|nr:hypothetical protein [Chloroflexota bacterium]